MNKKKKFLLSASLICSEMDNLSEDIRLLDKGGIDYIHFDVMDGLFVPRFGLFPEVLNLVKRKTKIPVDVHLMIENPEMYLTTFADAGAEIIVVHAEACKHLHRTVMLIKNLGVKVGVAINPATSVETLRYVIDQLDLVLIMAINPGIVGHKLIPETLEKIGEVKKMSKNRKDLLIQIDGGVSFDSAPLMVSKGANMLVCGTSSIFRQAKPLDEKIKELRKWIQEY